MNQRLQKVEMRVTATRNEVHFKPVELNIVIETQEEFNLWRNAAYGSSLNNAIGEEMGRLIYEQLKSLKK